MRQPSIGADQPDAAHQTNWAIADDLVYIQIQTDGRPQIMPMLVLRAAPFGLLALIPIECAKRSARIFCAISEKSWMSCIPRPNPTK
jgi:hypothetical protein